ncbi:DUF1150 family protein [Azospirillum rugosum]|uniref:DUF1150 family protein n=1 Tax=Azospirillum rugosum TaxID=416170 RepID=A0ABS4SNB8_9PROT|nr:DUF1150 family protein [Azospirillum rugosum]MBP2293422.1 hypothetical protein [Azospirillum rugosum]MDQ0530193.1 hypothetical protein [Azospirillum rugosum]
MTAPHVAPHVAFAATDSSFARYGITDVAYTRTVLLEGRTAYAVHAADGTCLWLDTDRETAVATLKDHGMSLVSVH